MDMDDIKDSVRDSPLYRLLRALKPRSAPQPLTPAQLKNQRYDEETVLVMQQVLAPDSVCIDGGCHHGSVLSEMCRLAPEARHYAFEPLPRLYKRLLRKFPGLHILPWALGECSGSATFTHVTNAPAFSGLRERNYDGLDAVKEQIPVQVVTVDEVIPQSTHIAFIKLDLEGGEYHALRGAMNTIRRCQPVIVFESGDRSSGYYGVNSEMLHTFFCDELDYNLSTMSFWLSDSEKIFTREEFLELYKQEFVFIAYPRS